MSRASERPRRMCMGCAERAPQSELIRIGSGADGCLQILSRRQYVGRTGYLHHKPACWQSFVMRKGLVRSLGRPVDRSVRGALLESLHRVERPEMIK